MSIPAIPSGYFVQQGNGQVYLSWNLAAGATSYQIQRSIDGVTYTPLATVLQNSFLDSAVTHGTQYFYKVAGVNSGSNATVNVVWGNVVGALVSGNTLTSVTPGYGHSAATSVQSVAPGETGFVQWVVNNVAGSQYVAGFRHGPFNNSYTTIDFGIFVFNSSFQVFESGAQVFGPLSLSNGDTVKVDLTGGLIRYYLNNTLVYTSLTLPVVPLFFAAAFNIPGNSLSPQINFLQASTASPFTAPQSVVPTLSGQMSLGQIRLLSQQRADRVNSSFVTLPEWNQYITQALYELYDLLIDCNQTYYVAPTAGFISNGSTYLYPLPDGVRSFIGPDGQSFVAPPFYKLLGVDMGLSNANNAWVTVSQFNFIDRNKFLYPNSASTIYGVFNCQYRIMGNNLEFIPVPSGNQPFRIWYIPRLKVPLKDSDLIDGVSGWVEYVIVRAAKYALDKEESDTTKLDQQLSFLIKRIEDSSANRDVGQADTISDTASAKGFWSGGWSRGGF